MKILGIDTATDILGVALTEDKELIVESRSNIKRAHAEKLVQTIEKILNEVKLNPIELDGIAVSIGPGSFTGLRIGLSAIKGLAFAADVPVASVPTLDALVLQTQFYPYQVRPLVKAQGDEAYTALYHFEKGVLSRDSNYQVININRISELIREKTLILNIGMKNLEKCVHDEKRSLIEIAPREFCKTSGYAVARIGYEKLLKNDIEDINQLEPFYLKNFKAIKKIGI
ncbi:tRNA (adenosine(37)-N6)-threonylcarbamoyltransferase complex dimerization subunit type 1 TsaB [candidate division KSB1 bacterium]|nr:tRNA (adenosine(37)-N6)-threonylcarbamoyltransferase complex dimerization subunit type 1 TsaB [candidate division KSB1 bacterium]MBL7095403.1 tRNA (adenosine(37)-N6)-threonylcarbamoyltransferase complex dimerization subunit type 1 TsaB [candidate division KSB1 bacterium]